jgi:hypothetical protein
LASYREAEDVVDHGQPRDTAQSWMPFLTVQSRRRQDCTVTMR